MKRGVERNYEWKGKGEKKQEEEERRKRGRKILIGKQNKTKPLTKWKAEK